MDNTQLVGEKKEFEKTVKCFENINWTCPDSIQLELFEISICSSVDLRRIGSSYRIKEIFLPEFNLSINKEYFSGKTYNIISNASDRFYSDSDTNKNVTRAKNWEKPKLIKSVILNRDTNTSDIEELFEMVSIYVKSQQMENQVKKLFEKINN